MCSNGSYCTDQNSICLPSGACVPRASSRVCPDGHHYCDEGFSCGVGDSCTNDAEREAAEREAAEQRKTSERAVEQAAKSFAAAQEAWSSKDFSSAEDKFKEAAEDYKNGGDFKNAKIMEQNAVAAQQQVAQQRVEREASQQLASKLADNANPFASDDNSKEDEPERLAGKLKGGANPFAGNAEPKQDLQTQAKLDQPAAPTKPEPKAVAATGNPPAPVAAPPAAGTNLQAPAPGAGACPSGSVSGITGLGGATPPASLLPPTPNCQYPGQAQHPNQLYNQGQATINYRRWDGMIMPIAQGFGLWLQNGELTVQRVDADHPDDVRPQGSPDPDGCMANTAYNTDSPAATGWVSLGCQMKRDQIEAQWVRDHQVCEADCLRHGGKVVHPNQGAEIGEAECRKSGGASLSFNPDGASDENVIDSASWPPSTRWCKQGEQRWKKIRNPDSPARACKKSDGSYAAIAADGDSRCNGDNEVMNPGGNNPFSGALPQ